jgi:hypothetical protein
MTAKQKTQRKYGRNRKSGQNIAYKLEHRREKSHVRRIKRHLLRYGRDEAACSALIRYATDVGLHVVRSAEVVIAGLAQ